MERVVFLIENTGQRIECLLNPESVVITRQAGLRSRRSLGGAVTGNAATDDRVLATGGGITQLQLELLFDTSKVGGPKPEQDVRKLTSPLWNLAENRAGDDDQGAPPQVRFVWGKSWNIPGVVSAVAERFERFSAAGIAQRSWVSVRFMRVNVDAAPTAAPDIPLSRLSTEAQMLDRGADTLLEHRVSGESVAQGEVHSAERTEQLAHRYYGNPAYWRLLAMFNDIGDPGRLATGMVLRVPSLGAPS
jgi:hypothetical protein